MLCEKLTVYSTGGRFISLTPSLFPGSSSPLDLELASGRVLDDDDDGAGIPRIRFHLGIESALLRFPDAGEASAWRRRSLRWECSLWSRVLDEEPRLGAGELTKLPAEADSSAA